MRVWMMNPNRLPSDGGLTPALIISDEPNDLLPGSSVVALSSEKVVPLEVTLEEAVRHYEGYGFIRVVPVEEVRRPTFVLIQHWPARGEQHRQAMEAVFQTAEKLGLGALDRWSARYTVVQLFDQEGSPIPPVLPEEAKAQLKDAHPHVWAVLSE